MNRSECPITRVLDVMGDKWTLLLVRDLLKGKTRYDEFLSSPEGISTNVLADRLARLVAEGIATKTPYQHNPVRYEYRLSKKGKELGPVVKAMYDWGTRFGS
ncbi:MAG: helix-turn-helix domain-containing protein [Planctomycetota bacterium]